MAKWINFVDNARAHVWDDIIWLDNRCLTRSILIWSTTRQTLVALFITIFCGMCNIVLSVLPLQRVPISFGVPNTEVWNSGLCSYKQWYIMRDFFFLSKSKHSGPSARQILSNNTTFKQKTLPLSCTPSGKFSDIWVMGDGWLRYSVLSTYEKTWFMYRHFDNPGQLFISDCIEPIPLFSAVFYTWCTYLEKKITLVPSSPTITITITSPLRL